MASCATAPRPEIEHISGPGYEGVLFSADYARRTYYVSGHPVWAATRKMAADFERRLSRRLKEQHISLASRWPDVRRQYLGLFEYGTGRRLMRVRLLCPSLYSETRLAPPEFEFIGANDCECVGWYDPAHKEILDFGCNMKIGTCGGMPRERDYPPSPPEPPFSAEPTPPP